MRRVFLFILLTGIISIFDQLKIQGQNHEPIIGINVGDISPEIAETGIDGKIIKLSDLQGKLVLLDFWASWCGPCRMENPSVVAAYQKYKNTKFKNGKGFAIYSISLDQSKDAWLAAIDRDKLEWPWHVSDLKGWNAKYAGIFQINSIPSNFLIDENGIIIAKNLRGTMLEDALNQLKK